MGPHANLYILLETCSHQVLKKVNTMLVFVYHKKCTEYEIGMCQITQVSYFVHLSVLSVHTICTCN